MLRQRCRPVFRRVLVLHTTGLENRMGIPRTKNRRFVHVAFLLASTFVSLACREAPTTWPDWRTTPDTVGIRSVIPTKRTCADCIHVSIERSIAIDTGAGVIDESPFVVRDRRGQIWVGSGAGLKVYGPDGSFVKHLGRPGRGPFEFQAAGPVFVDPTGNIHVLDQLAFRETIAADTGQFLSMRDLPVGPTYDAASLGDSVRIIVNATFLDPERIGQPLHLVHNGIVHQSFGSPNDTAYMATTQHLLRKVAVAPSGYIAAAHQNQYLLELFTKNGERLLRFERRGVWPAPPGGIPTDLTLNGELWGFIQDILVDEADRVWILSWEPRADWRENVREVVAPNGQRLVVQKEFSTPLHRSRIEVVDLRSGTLLGTQSYEETLWGFLNADAIYGYRYDERGEPQLATYRVVLRLPQPD